MTASSPTPAPIEPIAYLTVEVKQREFDSRLLIACHLLKAGFTVMVGQQWGMFANADTLPPGVVLFKTVNDIQAENMQLFRRFGHLVAATDEEVLICMTDYCFMTNFGPLAAQNCDLFLAQSDPHKAAIVGRFPELADRIQVTGNARIAGLGPARRGPITAEGEALRREHGRYVLFNTNFGSVNTVWGSIELIADIWARAGVLDRKDPKSVAMFQAMIAWEQRNFDELIQLIDWSAANLTEFKIVVRPHPAERKEFWLDRYAGNPRVLVIPRTPPHPWIMGAELTMHTACTTGLEAALMDHPSLNLVPGERPDFEPLTSHVNPVVRTWQEAAAAAEAFLRSGTGPIADYKDSYRPALDKFFPTHQAGDATRLIADHMGALLRAHGALPDPAYLPKSRKKGYRPYPRIDALKEKITVSGEEMVKALTAANKMVGVPGRVVVEEVDDSLFLLKAK